MAIANHRLLAIGNGLVRFRWRDYRRGGKRRQMTLPDYLERYRQITGRSLLECPACDAEAMRTVGDWRPGEEPPPLEDTS